MMLLANAHHAVHPERGRHAQSHVDVIAERVKMERHGYTQVVLSHIAIKAVQRRTTRHILYCTRHAHIVGQAIANLRTGDHARTQAAAIGLVTHKLVQR